MKALQDLKTKWGGIDREDMTEEQEKEFVNDCFVAYERIGFLDRFNSPYDDNSEHNGMVFRVIRRAVVRDADGNLECDLEAMPVWLVEFENGDTAFCYPEEICKTME